MKAIRTVLAISILVTMLLASTGCSGTGVLSAIAQGLMGTSGGIDLSGGLGTGSGGLSGIGGPGEAGTTGLGGSISQPGAFTPAPQGSNTLSTPNLSSASAQQCLAELQKRGIRVAGYPDEEAVKNCLIAARQIRPENSQGVTIYFEGGDGSSGILGMWRSSGYISMYTNDAPTATFHEMVHHATLAGTSSQGAQVGQQVMQWISSRVGGGPGSWPSVVTPGSYARSNEDEFQAEFFSVMRVMDLNLPWNRLAENGQSGVFNPPQELRSIANQFYDPSGATTGSGTTATAGTTAPTGSAS